MEQAPLWRIFFNEAGDISRFTGKLLLKGIENMVNAEMQLNKKEKTL
jgi:hypothetical protein